MQYLCVYCKPVHSHSLFLSLPHTCNGADEYQLCQHLKPEMNCWHLLHSPNLTCPCTFCPLTDSHSAHFVPEFFFLKNSLVHWQRRWIQPSHSLFIAFVYGALAFIDSLSLPHLGFHKLVSLVVQVLDTILEKNKAPVLPPFSFCMWESVRECVCVCVCVWERERGSVCVCVWFGVGYVVTFVFLKLGLLFDFRVQ